MNEHLRAGPQPPNHEVHVGISGEQQQLKEQHAGGPHGGRATEPRQDQLRNQRLRLKQEEGRDKCGKGERQQGARAPPPGALRHRARPGALIGCASHLPKIGTAEAPEWCLGFATVLSR